MAQRDEFDDPDTLFSRLSERLPMLRNRSLVISGLVFVFVVALSGVIWASYPREGGVASSGSVPIIRADADSYKTVPSDRGGMNIPHRDSTVFAAMRDGDPDRKIENLLDDSETPVDRQQLFAGLKNDLAERLAAGEVEENAGEVKIAGISDFFGGSSAERPKTESERRTEAARRNREALEEKAAPLPGSVENKNNSKLPGVLRLEDVKPVAGDTTNETVDLPTEIPAAPAQQAAPVVEAARPEPAPAYETAPAPQPVKQATAPTAKTLAEKAPAAGTPKMKTGSGDTYVQVSSVQERSRVDAEWRKITGALPMLSGMGYRVQSKDLGAKGTYHRIQVGPLTKADATKLCDQIKARKPGGCLIAR